MEAIDGPEPAGAGSVRDRLRVAAWFSLGLATLCYLGSVRYLIGYSWPDSSLTALYLITTYAGYLGALALVPLLVATVLIGIVRGGTRLECVPGAAAVLMGAVLLAFIQVDGLVYYTDRFHLTALALRVLGPPTWAFAGVSFAISALACVLLLRVVTRQRPATLSGRRAALAIGAIVFALVVSQGVHAWADVRYYVPVTSLTQRFPLYRPLTGKHLLARWIDVIDLAQAREAGLRTLDETSQRTLSYPLSPLACTPGDTPMNVLIIGLDAMRADSVSERVAPSIERFSREAIRFREHFSGGNGTRPGLFSLFYGIPATYWNAFYAEQRGPVLIDVLQEQGYQMAIFPGNPVDRLIGLDRTAFRKISNLPSTSGDAATADGFIGWLGKRDPSRPFFGFLFFESAPGACPDAYARPAGADPSAPGDAGLRGCYETAIHYADAQTGRVLEALRAEGLAENSIVIVTSDHGQEFNENGLGFRGHGSAYSRFQLQTPMLIRWPGRAPADVTYRTSHHDLAPTLLQEALGCSSPPSDYSSGQSLFDGQGWPWLVAASYTSRAILEPERVTVSYGAYYEVRDAGYRIVDEFPDDTQVLSEAVRETARFSR